MIGTLPRGIGSVLDAADLDAFWAAADDVGAAIHIHPSFDAGDVRTYDFGLQNGVGRITDAMVAVARLICSGHIARYANVKFIAPMGSVGLPFLIGRLRRNFEVTPGSAIRSMRWRASIPTPCSMIPACCGSSSRSSAPTAS